MRTMYDSTNIFDIPTDAEMVGYYVDGIYAVSEWLVRARFPHAVLVGISAVGTNAGVVGDVEPGCMSPSQGVQWVVKRRAAGVDPTIYINQTYGWQPMRKAFQALGIAEPHYWVANYDRIIALPLGAVAKQYTNPVYSGGHYDLSCVADFWPGVDSEEDDVTPEQDAILRNVQAAINDLNYAFFYNEDGTPRANPGTAGGFAKLVNDNIRAIVKEEIANQPVSVTVPTTITLSGKLS